MPRIIALCGHPTSGKSTVQEILKLEYGYNPVDDGEALREIAIEWFGLTREDVYTQEGKLRASVVAGKLWQHRDLLGKLGVKLEELLGADVMPYMATRHLEYGQRYSFGSVRRRQGAFYQQLGGVVLGIRNPLAGPSPYEFDQFDESVVDFWIDNRGPALGWPQADSMRLLRDTVAEVMQRVFNLSALIQEKAA